jgi:hypothetical protein
MNIPTVQEYTKAYFLKYKDAPANQKNLIVEHFLPFIEARREQEWYHRDCPANELTDNDI